MLKDALHFRKRNDRSKAKECILLVDGDRSAQDDGWSLSQLREEAAKHKMTVCVQIPNQEGLLLRMMPGRAALKPNSSIVQEKLRRMWPEYRKPVDAYMLAAKFSLDDLLRAAKHDSELKTLLSIIRLI